MSLRFFSWRKSSREKPALTAQASNQSIVIYGDVTDSLITTGIDPVVIEDIQGRVTNLEAEAKLSRKAVLALIQRLPDSGLEQDRFGTAFEHSVESLLAVRSDLERSNDQPESGYALQLIDEGQLDEASAVLTSARTSARARRTEATLEEAGLINTQAILAEAQLRYTEAADLYAEAADLVEGLAPERTWFILFAEAKALLEDGRLFGHPGSLRRAIRTLERCEALEPKAKNDLRWIAVQHQMGLSLMLLGESTGDESAFRRSVTLLRTAATELAQLPPDSLFMRAKARLAVDVAEYRNDLACALTSLGERLRDEHFLNEAVAIFREVLDGPIGPFLVGNRASVIDNLGTVLQALSDGASNLAGLESARELHLDALKRLSPEKHGRQWAFAANNLGAALFKLAKARNDPAIFGQAAQAFRDALRVRTKDRFPKEWRQSERNLAETLYEQGLYARDGLVLAGAILEYTILIDASAGREIDPDIFFYRLQRGKALQLLAKRFGPLDLEEAIKDFRAIIAQYGTISSNPLYLNASAALAESLIGLEDERKDVAPLKEAISILEKMRQITDTLPKPEAALIKLRHAAALRKFGERSNDGRPIIEAAKLVQAALTQLDKQEHRSAWAKANEDLSMMARMLSDSTGHDDWLDVWLNASRAAADATDKDSEPMLWANRAIAAAVAVLTAADQRGDLAGAKNGLDQIKEAVETVVIIGRPEAVQGHQPMIDMAENLVRRLS